VGIPNAMVRVSQQHMYGSDGFARISASSGLGMPAISRLGVLADEMRSRIVISAGSPGDVAWLSSPDGLGSMPNRSSSIEWTTAALESISTNPSRHGFSFNVEIDASEFDAEGVVNVSAATVGLDGRSMSD